MDIIENPIKELEIKKDVFELLSALTKNQQVRVWRWVGEVLELYSGSVMRVGSPTASAQIAASGQNEVEWSTFNSAAEVLSAGTAKDDNERVLLVASFLQEKYQKTDLTGFEISEALKHVGHRLSNVTVTISRLINRRPSWMIQTRKEGKTQQARKKYKVTTEGLKQAVTLLSGIPNDGEEAA